MMRWQRKSSLVLALSLLIAGLVWSQMGMYLAHLMFGVNLQVNFFKFCMSLFKEKSFYYFLVITFLNVLIVYTILITLIKFAQQYVLSRRFRNKIMALTDHTLTDQIIRDYKPQNNKFIVIDHKQSMAFTMGFRSPLIVISTGLIGMLDRHELEAVIEHETFHQNNRDSLKIFILQLISQALWFIPLTKWTYQNYTIISELMADEYAIKKTGSELGLGSALLKLIKNCFHENGAPVLAHFADGSVNYRLQQLVDPQRDIPVKLETTSFVISVYVLLLFMSMIVLAVT